MILGIKSKIAVIPIVWSLSACNTLVDAPGRANAVDSPVSGNEMLASEGSRDLCDRRGLGTTIDAYKKEAAYHISRSNLGNTFDGRLPPMLPAVVVLRISVDSAGAVTDVSIQRSRDKVASKIAMESIQRSGRFPLPCSLINDRNPVLSFSETFLFNVQYQFQLRSLADPQ